MKIPVFETGESIIANLKTFRNGVLFKAVRYAAYATLIILAILVYSNGYFYLPLLITALLISFAFSSPYGYLVTNKRLILVTFSSLFVGNVPSLTSGNFSWIYYQDILDIRLHKSLLDKIFGTGKIIFTVKMGPYVANKFLVGRGLTPSGISSGHKLVFSLVNNPDETLTKIKEIAGENKSAGPEAAQAFNVSDFLKTPPASQIIITVLITLGAIALFAALIYFFSIRP